MEQIPEKKEVSVKLPSSYLRNIYATLLIANNRATWHPDELTDSERGQGGLGSTG